MRKTCLNIDSLRTTLRWSIVFPILAAVVLFAVKTGRAQDAETARPFGLVIHGGAGSISKDRITPEREAAYQAKLQEAIEAGYAILEGGGSSFDAVETTINIMEDSPLFNAGKGAVFSNDGTNEMDASIMDGRTLNAGAVASIKHIKNPISLARLVLENSPHVMLVGAGAEEFGAEHGIEKVSNYYFFTDRRWKSLQRTIAKQDSLNKAASEAGTPAKAASTEKGTVGCAALDKQGNLAAGTSTGGLTNKRWGRVGDSPIIGAGTYANNATCAVSGTGQGEYFMRLLVAHDIHARMFYQNKALADAAKEVIHGELTKLGGAGGIISIDKNGNIAMTFNTAGMFRGYRTNSQPVTVQMYGEE